MPGELNTSEAAAVSGGSQSLKGNDAGQYCGDVCEPSDGFLGSEERTCVRCGNKFRITHWSHEKETLQKTLYCSECRGKGTISQK